jgi:hypothetical protein
LKQSTWTAAIERSERALNTTITGEWNGMREERDDCLHPSIHPS